MPTWRCPHCRTPQAESSRCWVCGRSSTTCASCADFRRAIAGNIGYCGLDARRVPLRGDEIRACWSSADAVPGAVGGTLRGDDHGLFGGDAGARRS